MTLYEQEMEVNLGDNMNKKLSAILITSIISSVSLAQNPYPVDNAIVF